MQVIKGDKFIYFDVDDTLVMWDYLAEKETRVGFQEPWEDLGREVWLTPNPITVEAIKKAKAEGSTVIVWSQGGWDWALSAVKTLKLEQYVDAVMSKPHEFYDDVPAERFMHTRIDSGAEYYKGKK